MLSKLLLSVKMLCAVIEGSIFVGHNLSSGHSPQNYMTYVSTSAVAQLGTYATNHLGGQRNSSGRNKINVALPPRPICS